MSDDKRAVRDQSGPIFSRLFGRRRSALSDEIVGALEDAGREANPTHADARRDMIERVIAFDEKRVDDVMAPRADIVAVDVATPLDALVRCFAEAGHSRLPIYRDDLDDPIGMVHIKDVVDLIANPQKQISADGHILNHIRREILYAPPSMRVTDLLLKMQASRIHMALVVDEYGGTDGLVTIEDLVEEIVGEINDEHDDEDSPIILARDGGWEANARVELDEFRDETGLDLTLDDDDEVDTLGGLVGYLAGRVPHRGEVLSHPDGVEIEIIAADQRRVRKVFVQRRVTDADPVAEAAE